MEYTWRRYDLKYTFINCTFDLKVQFININGGCMKKYICLFLCIIILFTGCTTKKASDFESSVSDSAAQNNPFDIDTKNDSTVIASYGFKANSIDENNHVIQYNGGELEVDFSLMNSQIPCEAGIMLYVNGVAQPYSTEEYSNKKLIQPYQLGKNETKIVKAKFIPAVGKKGETLDIYCTAMLNPSFVPSENVKNILPNHSIIQTLPWNIQCNQDSANSELNICTKYNISDITQETKDKYIQKDKDGNITGNSLDQSLNVDLTDGTSSLNNLNLSSGDKKITLQCLGGKEYKYRISFYINHKLVPVFDGKDYLDITMTKDKMITKDIILNAKNLSLNDYNSMYVVAVPLNPPMSFDAPGVEKTSSVILIKGST